MKKTNLIMIFLLLIISSNLNAQKIFLYESSDFNIMLKCNADNSKVLEILCTDANKSKWIQCEITDFKNISDKETVQIRYTIKNGADKQYYIDYFKYSDYIIVTKISDGKNWTMYRKPE